MPNNETTAVLPIVPYASLEAAFDHFYEAGGAPNELHASVFPKNKFSGTTIALLVRSFKQLGLADNEGNTRHEQIDPLINPETRRQAMLTLLGRVYRTLMDLPLPFATPNQFNKWFDEYHLNPEDTRKAKTFFLHAAKANDIPVSAFIINKYKTRSRPSGKPAAQRETKRKESGTKHPTRKQKPGQLGEEVAEMRVVELQGTVGAKVTLTVSKGIMQLERSDRDFVLELINAIEDYERGGPE